MLCKPLIIHAALLHSPAYTLQTVPVSGDDRKRGRGTSELTVFSIVPIDRLDFCRFLVSGLRSDPRREFGGGARAPFANSG